MSGAANLRYNTKPQIFLKKEIESLGEINSPQSNILFYPVGQKGGRSLKKGEIRGVLSLIDWEASLTPEVAFSFREALFACNKDEDSGDLKYGYMGYLRRAVNLISKAKPQKLSDITKEQMIDIVVDDIATHQGHVTEKRLRSKPHLRAKNARLYFKFLAYLDTCQLAYREGAISDWLPEVSKRDFQEGGVGYEKLCDALENLGITYSDWIAGGTRAGLPTSIATMLLLFCMRTVESSKTKAILTLFDAYRTIEENSEQSEMSRPDISRRILDFEVKIRAIRDSARCDYRDLPEPLVQEIRVISDSDFESLFNPPSKARAIRFGLFRSELKRIRMACYLIFLCVSGIRESELRVLRRDRIEIEQKSISFDGPEFKTNRGVSTKRFITRAFLPYLEVLDGLRLSDMDGVGLFHVSVPFSDHLSTGLSAFASDLDSLYEDFLIECEESIREIAPAVSEHMLRHVFAALALRRFKGGKVFELVREHYRHQAIYGDTDSYFTPFQTKEESVFYSREMLREMFGEHFNGESKMYGALAKQITQMVDSLKLGTPEEISKFLDEEFSDLEVELEPHEFGLCVIVKGQESVAKCFDKETSRAKTEDARESMCTGCPNFCYTDGNKDSLERARIQAEILKENRIMYAVHGSKIDQTIKNIESRLNVMETKQ